MSRIRIGNLIRQARNQAGLSQRVLARRARTAQSVVARIELGTTSPSMDTIARLLRAAGFELATELRPRAVLDRQLLDDVPRILRLTPEDRLREVANINRFVANATPTVRG
jgi:transcriptional regulator with XRE-family HTH domain